MGNFIIPDVGEVKIAELALKGCNQTLKLFVNDVTPAETFTAASLTEMSTNGYAAKTVLGVDWSAATVAGVTTIANIAQTWTFTAGTAITIYGVYLIDASSGILLGAQRFDDPMTVSQAGESIIITPKITFE